MVDLRGLGMQSRRFESNDQFRPLATRKYNWTAFARAAWPRVLLLLITIAGMSEFVVTTETNRYSLP
jgi:hypothetical protein